MNEINPNLLIHQMELTTCNLNFSYWSPGSLVLRGGQRNRYCNSLTIKNEKFLDCDEIFTTYSSWYVDIFAISLSVLKKCQIFVYRFI